MSINLNKLDAIIFDLGGVIYSLDYNLTIDAFKELGQENFDQLYSQAMQNNIFDKFETGDMPTNEFVDYLFDFLPNENDKQVVIDAWNKMLLEIPAYRLEFINSLKTEVRVFLLSNTNDIHYKEVKLHVKDRFGKEDFLDDIFENTYYSHLIHKRKPNADAFEHVLQENQLEATTTLFIDDSIQHIEGANKIGLQTYHLVNEDIIDIFDRPNP